MESDQAVADLQARMAALESDLGARMTALENRLADLAVPSQGPGAVPPAAAYLPPPPRPRDAVGSPPGTRPGGRSPVSLPRFEIGVEAILRWVGIGLVVLAAVFLVSTAIERGWISRELQLLGATLIGLALLAVAVRLVESERRWALALANGGSVVIIVCAGASYGWLELWDPLTGLGLVGVAAAVAVLAAMKLRFESVAITATGAMLVVPAWARIIADAPVLGTGIWLGLFAIVATVVGVERRWSLYRTVSTWAAAVWVIGLAGFLFADDNTEHLVAGTALVAVVGATLWLGPALTRLLPGPASDNGSVEGVDHRRRRKRWANSLDAVEHRSVVLIPVWSWYSILLFGGFDADVPGGWLGLALAAGFAVVALVAGPILDRIAKPLLGSHLLGVSLLVTVSIVAWLGGPALMVALAGQALATLLVAYYFDDEVLKLNGYVLAGGAWLVLVDELIETIDRATFDLGDSSAYAVVVVALAAVAWITERDRSRSLAEAVFGIVWLAAMGFAVSLVAPVVDGETWLVVGVGLAAAGLAAGRRFGPWVMAMGAGIAVVTVIGGALSIVVTAVDGNDVVGHLANLSVVVGLLIGTAWMWSTGRWSDAARALLVLAWVFALGWPASVFLAELAGSQGQVATSVVWAIAACGAIVVAIRSDEAIVRFLGLGTLAVVLVKLLTVDLAAVDTLWRVGLFLVIGLGLLRLGYVLPALAERYGPDPDRKDTGGPGGDSGKPGEPVLAAGAPGEAGSVTED